MRRSRSLLSFALSVAVAGGLGLASPAAAQPGWGAVVDVSDPVRFTYGPDLAVSPAGVALAVWPRGDERLELMAAWQRPGGAWSTPRRVPGSKGAMEAEAAFDRDGDLVLAWTSGRRVVVVRRQARGPWEAPTTVHRTAAGARGTRPADLDLAVNAVGRAVVSWETMDDDRDATYARSRVQAAVGGPGGRWTRATTLSSPRRDAFGPKAALSRTGRAVVVWDEITGSRGQIMTASRDAGEGWAPARSLSRRLGHPADPQLAALPSGELAVAWSSGGSTPSIMLRRWRPNQGWGRAASVPGVEVDAWWLAIGMDGRGAVTIAWSNQAKAVWVAEQKPQGWTRSRVAPSGSVFYGLRLDVNRAGDAVVGWDGRWGRDGHVAQAAYRSRAGSWVPATTLSDRRGDAAGTTVALAGDGTATAAWLFGRRTSSASRIQARTYDVL
jgi:hypothetical protein